MDRLAKSQVVPLAVAWPVLLVIGTVIEPAPNPSYTAGPIETAVGFALLLTLGITAVGLASRRRWGAAASLVASVSLGAMTIMCPISNHHEVVGAWWFGQLLIAAGVAALSARTLAAREESSGHAYDGPLGV